MGTAMKHPVPDRMVKPSFVIFDIRALWRSALSPDVKNYKWRLNQPVWHRMLHSCTHMATVGVKGLSSCFKSEWRKSCMVTRNTKVHTTLVRRRYDSSSSSTTAHDRSYSDDRDAKTWGMEKETPKELRGGGGKEVTQLTEGSCPWGKWGSVVI